MSRSSSDGQLRLSESLCVCFQLATSSATSRGGRWRPAGANSSDVCHCSVCPRIFNPHTQRIEMSPRWLHALTSPIVRNLPRPGWPRRCNGKNYRSRGVECVCMENSINIPDSVPAPNRHSKVTLQTLKNCFRVQRQRSRASPLPFAC